MPTTLDKTFNIGVSLKLIDGALECLGGLLLLAVSPSAINRLAVILTEHELSRDPHDFIATHILHSTAMLTHGTEIFGAIYLLVHGVSKVGLAIALLKRQLWSYPVSLVFLAAFMLYQIYRIGYNHSISLTLLTIFDAVVVWLIWREWQVVKAKS